MSLLDDAISAMDNALEVTGATWQEWSQEWDNAINNMQAKAREFITVFQRLEAKRTEALENPALKDDYETLMNRGGWLKSTIESILPGSAGMGNMGALPLIPIAAVLAAIAAITAWLAPAYVMLQKLELAEKMLAQGQDPTRIIEAGEGSIFTDISDTAKATTQLALVGGSAFLLWKFWPQIQKAFK